MMHASTELAYPVGQIVIEVISLLSKRTHAGFVPYFAGLKEARGAENEIDSMKLCPGSPQMPHLGITNTLAGLYLEVSWFWWRSPGGGLK